MSDISLGRRERKKAATRQALAASALQLFLERGYDEVSIREVADAADVSTTTLFKYFPSKESLVFDEEKGRESELIAAVQQRPAGQSILDALHQHVVNTYLTIAAHPQATEFIALVQKTPALRSYSEQMWTRHTDSLSAAIAEELGVHHDDVRCLALARFVLDIPIIARRQRDRRAAVEIIFALLEQGWNAPEPPPARSEQVLR